MVSPMTAVCSSSVVVCTNLPDDIFVYSGVFDVGWLDIARACMEAFDEKKVSESWPHSIGTYWG